MFVAPASMTARLIAIHFKEYDLKKNSQYLGIAIPTDTPFPVWKLYQLFPEKMVCEKGTKIPLQDLEFDIAASNAENLTYDVRIWKADYESLRAKVASYLNSAKMISYA